MGQSTELNILIVEDNASVSNIISRLLTKQHLYNVYTTANILQAKRLLNKIFFDLICLDIVLPDGNGLNLCKELKADPYLKSTKIIIISRKTTLQNRIEAFDNGADDYLPKPFFPDELNARVKRLLGLSEIEMKPVAFKNFSINTISMKLLYEKYELPLTKTELLILTYLFEHEGFANLDFLTQFLSSKKLKSVKNQSVVVSMQRLREKLRKNTGNPFIKTKYGSGYYLM